MANLAGRSGGVVSSIAMNTARFAASDDITWSLSIYSTSDDNLVNGIKVQLNSCCKCDQNHVYYRETNLFLKTFSDIAGDLFHFSLPMPAVETERNKGWRRFEMD
jgi:hypothetical protein